MLLIILLNIAAFAYVHKQEQHLMDIYNHMNTLKESISQLEYYTALEQLEMRFKNNREFEEENLVIYKEHYNDVKIQVNQLLAMLKDQFKGNKMEKDEVKMFMRETFPEVIEKIKRIIQDKEKLIEGDIKELAKIKHTQTEDFGKRFEEFNYLHQKIQEGILLEYLVLETNDPQDIYKALELLESKIMIGSFKQMKSDEVDFFMKSVDQLFKEKNNNHKKEGSIQLLSLMRSVISEYLIKMMNDQLEASFDILDKELFFTQSKNTHIAAKEQYLTLLHNFEQTHLTVWKDILETSYDDQILEIAEEQQNQAIQAGTKSIQYQTQMEEMLKAMLERFLKR